MLALALAGIDCRADNPAEVLELPQVRVVGTTPLPGSDVALPKVPANVQIFTSRDLRRQRHGGLTEFLEQNATGLTVGAAQGNPYQPDINFRGFTASPLLGTPQGLSVFLDGVRVNEPFGDTVNWDLIPQSAISSIQLIPGSNPAYGLNTLGGAIALYTKSGAAEYPDAPGGSITLSGGSFGRRTLEFETGGKRGHWDWFLTGNDSSERGWALHNASHVKQWFGKVGWQDDDTDIDIALTSADNTLQGAQTIPLSFPDVRQPYTYPDQNVNRATLVSIKGSHALSPTLLLSGSLYGRRFTTRNLSSNVNDNAADPAPATNDLSSIQQNSGGFGVQIAHDGEWARRHNKLSVGASLDQGRARFTHTAQDATFTPDRGTVGTSDFAAVTDASSSSRHLGVFIADSLDLDKHWTLSLAGRFNRADVSIADLSGTAPELTGSHRFTRFNPAIGLNFNPSGALTAYASYNEGMRAPTAIELTCADPNAPCQLPNSFLADPPLLPVVSKTLELGARGRLDADTSWSAAIFRTDLHNDLQFVSSDGITINAGYFQNVGTTRRQGLELGGSARSGPVAWTLHYSFVDATYRSGFVENSPSNSTADAQGAIQVRRGDRMPSIPRHALKLRAELNPTTAWRVAANLQIASDIRARGDENNRDAHGHVPGYGVLNLDTSYQVTPRLQFFARIDNVFDRRYASFGILGSNAFTGPAQSFDPAQARAEQFRGHAAPRRASIGMQFAFE